jgi:hypothetical protein
MADGDFYIDEETGRGEVISGPDKADQDLADNYLTEYDVARNWGANLSLTSLGTNLTPREMKAMLFVQVSQANQRMLEKQSRDLYPTVGEMIVNFPRLEVAYDVDSQAVFFLTVANLDDGSIIQKGGSLVFKPVSLNHIIPPPTDIANNIIKG